VLAVFHSLTWIYNSNKYKGTRRAQDVGWKAITLRGVRWDWIHLVYRPLLNPLNQLRLIGRCGTIWRMRIGSGNRCARRKPALVTSSTTNSTWPDLGSNQERHGGNQRLTSWAIWKAIVKRAGSLSGRDVYERQWKAAAGFRSAAPGSGLAVMKRRVQ
jgi:hypothetical protein